MSVDDLLELARKAQDAFDKLTPSGKLRHLYEQRRSFVRGMCPSSTDFKHYCAEVDKRLPPPNDLTDAEIGLAILGRLAPRVTRVPPCVGHALQGDE